MTDLEKAQKEYEELGKWEVEACDKRYEQLLADGTLKRGLGDDEQYEDIKEEYRRRFDEIVEKYGLRKGKDGE